MLAVFGLVLLTDPMLLVGYQSMDHVILHFKPVLGSTVPKDQTQPVPTDWCCRVVVALGAVAVGLPSRSSSARASFYRSYLRFSPCWSELSQILINYKLAKL